MDVSTIIRGEIATALSGLSYDGIAIPIFDEIVNPSIEIPIIEGAEVYVVVQDQQSQDSASQNTCAVRIDADVTIRVVTKWGTVGSKKLCEDIGVIIDSKLRTKRNISKLNSVLKTSLVVSRTILEKTQSNLAFSKILIYNHTLNI